MKKQVECPSAGSKAREWELSWCLLGRAGGPYDGRYKAGESGRPLTLCSAEELDFILRSVGAMQYLDGRMV